MEEKKDKRDEKKGMMGKKIEKRQTGQKKRYDGQKN